MHSIVITEGPKRLDDHPRINIQRYDAGYLHEGRLSTTPKNRSNHSSNSTSSSRRNEKLVGNCSKKAMTKTKAISSSSSKFPPVEIRNSCRLSDVSAITFDGGCDDYDYEESSEFFFSVAPAARSGSLNDDRSDGPIIPPRRRSTKTVTTNCNNIRGDSSDDDMEQPKQQQQHNDDVTTITTTAISCTSSATTTVATTAAKTMTSKTTSTTSTHDSKGLRAPRRRSTKILPPVSPRRRSTKMSIDGGLSQPQRRSTKRSTTAITFPSPPEDDVIQSFEMSTSTFGSFNADDELLNINHFIDDDDDDDRLDEEVDDDDDDNVDFDVSAINLDAISPNHNNNKGSWKEGSSSCSPVCPITEQSWTAAVRTGSLILEVDEEKEEKEV